MNNKISTYIGLALLTAFASCADDKFADFQTEKPESLTQYEYLNAYDNLKSYIDRSAHPGFKLGAGVSADDFLKENWYAAWLSATSTKSRQEMP